MNESPENESATGGKTNFGSTRHHRLAYTQRGAEAVCGNCLDESLIDYELARAIAIALYRVGFGSAHKRALESFRAAVEEYMHNFSAKVHASMTSNRRTQPIPQDFVFAMVQSGLISSSFDLESSSFSDNLDPSTLASVTQPALPSPVLDVDPAFTLASFLQPDEGSLADRQNKPYVPRHFPRFPNQHAYHDTPVFAARENDALKIREHATQEGMQAEQALRKLMQANAQSGKGVRKRGHESEVGEAIWQEALAAAEEEDAKRRKKPDDDMMDDLFGADDSNDKPFGKSGPEDGLEINGIVNHSRMFWRRSAIGDVL